MLKKVLSILSRLAKEGTSVDEDTKLQADIGLTSLQVMELVFEIEEDFDISIPMNHLPVIQTVRDLTQEIVAILEH